MPIALSLTLAAGACVPVEDMRSPEPESPRDVSGDDGSEGAGQDPAARAATSLEGTYRGTQTWDFSAMTLVSFESSSATEATLAALVSMAGLPSFLADDAEELLAEIVGDELSGYFDGAVADSGVLDELRTGLGSVTLGTALSLQTDPDGTLSGTERITSVHLMIEGQPVEIPLGQVLPVLGYDDLVADLDLSLDDSGTLLTVADHEYLLRVDSIVEVAGQELLGFDDLEAALATIVDCDALIDAMTGGVGTLEISVASYEVAFGADDLSFACEAARDELSATVLDMFQTHTGVVVGGTLAVSRDGKRSLANSDYRGALTQLPPPLRPSFDVALAVEVQ